MYPSISLFDFSSIYVHLEALFILGIGMRSLDRGRLSEGCSFGPITLQASVPFPERRSSAVNLGGRIALVNTLCVHPIVSPTPARFQHFKPSLDIQSVPPFPLAITLHLEQSQIPLHRISPNLLNGTLHLSKWGRS